MLVDIHAKPNMPHQQRAARAFADGLEKHGISYRMRCCGGAGDGDVAVFWSMNQWRLAGHRPAIVLEAGFWDRDTYVQAAWNGINGHADHCAEHSPPDRWEAQGHTIKPWKLARDGLAVLAGQHPGDWMVAHLDYQGALDGLAERMRNVYGQAAVFRPHPLAQDVKTSLPTLEGDLDTALEAASVWVTVNSNSAVDAMLAGVLPVTIDCGSVIYEATSHNPAWPRIFDRRPWAYNLAYSHWTHDEMAAGATWEHLAC